jgi:hypothetical protein
MDFLIPWHDVGTSASQLELELQSEVGLGHPLKNKPMRAIATREDCDDVLFVGSDDPTLVAVVHLTYANRPEPDPRWPNTTFFTSLQDWFEREMRADHDDFNG